MKPNQPKLPNPRLEAEARATPTRVPRPLALVLGVFGAWALLWRLVLRAWCLLSGGCSFAPKYQRPAVQTPAAFKELTPAKS